jgi:hypothetical protein
MAFNRGVPASERAPFLTRALAFCLIWLGSIWDARAPALAQAPLPVVLLDSGDHARAERVRAELEASGFSAQIVSMPQAGDVGLQLVEATLRERARLGLGLRTANGSSELLVYDAESGQLEAHPFAQGGDANEATFAIRVVELLRASLLPVATGTPAVMPEQPEASPLAPAVAQAAAPVATTSVSEPTRSPSAEARPANKASSPGRAPEPSRELDKAARAYAALELGIAVLGSPGGLGPAVTLALSTSAFLTRSLQLGAYTLVPLSTMKHEAAEGSSRTRVTLVGLDLGGEFFRDSPLRTSLAGGFTVAVLATEGHSSFSDLSDASTRRASFGAHLRGAVAYHFTRLLALRGALSIGSQFSPFSIEYAGRTAAHWGLPWISAQLLFELRFSGNS